MDRIIVKMSSHRQILRGLMAASCSGDAKAESPQLAAALSSTQGQLKVRAPTELTLASLVSDPSGC